MLAAVFFALETVGAEPPSLRVAAVGRDAELTWSIAGSGGYPNILSELTWNNLTVRGLEIDAVVPVVGGLEGRARARAGLIVSGDNQDSDYSADNRQGEYSRSNNNASGGMVWDVSAALGYRLRPAGWRLSFLPTLGLEVVQDRLRMTDGYQTITPDPINLPLGPFNKTLDSRYIATWYGPWIGGEVLYEFAAGGGARLSFGYQLNAYYGWADWNLRDEFDHPKSFAQRAYGQEFRAAVEVAVPLSAAVLLSLEGDVSLGATATGTDRTYYANGTTADTQFNGVEWWSLGGSAGVRFLLSRPPAARSHPKSRSGAGPAGPVPH